MALYRKDRRQCFHYISVVSWVFYLCYLAYIFLPVIGRPALHEELTGQALPADLMPPGPVAWPAAVQAGPFYQIMALIYRHMETPGAAFPSSHVAVALTTVYFSFLYLRPIRYGHLALALLLSLATVYCRYHYAVDALAGGPHRPAAGARRGTGCSGAWRPRKSCRRPADRDGLTLPAPPARAEFPPSRTRPA